MRNARLGALARLGVLVLGGLSGAVGPMTSQEPARVPPRYALSATVTDAEGTPLEDADVVLIQDSVPSRHFRADAHGRIQVADLLSPLAVLRVRHIGFRARMVPVRISTTSRRASIVIALDNAVVELQGLSIIGEDVEPDARLREFNERRKNNSFGSYIDRSVFERTRPVYVSEVLRQVRSISILPSRRIGNLVRIRGCAPLLWVDGVRLPGAELDEVVQPADIAAMEIYASFAGIPARFFDRTATCGTLVVWTRSR